MAVFLDPATPVRFQPPGGRIAYLLRVPRVSDRVALDREIARSGGRRHSVIQLLALLRRGIEQALPEQSEERDTLLAKVEACAEAQRAVWEMAQSALDAGENAGEKGGENDEARQAFIEACTELSARNADLTEVAGLVQQLYAPYADAVADNEVYGLVQGMAAAKLFITGWEGLSGEPKRGPLGLDEASLARIPEYHMAHIGAEVRRLMAPTENEEKNSGSPSRSLSSPSSSAAAKKPARKTRS